MNQSVENKRLVIVSNRLPVVLSEDSGRLSVSSGSGGLITALAPILKNRGGIWIGWPGEIEADKEEEAKAMLAKQKLECGYHFLPVFLSQEEVKLYYEGFSNQIIWPLFHDLPSDCRFDPAYWDIFQEVNRKFAEATKKALKPHDFLWVHDYHLMLVGENLRKLNVKEAIGFFLHIPFPSPDIFIKLPWRFQILRALLSYNLVGFQTLRDQRHFIRCVKLLLPEVKISSKRFLSTCTRGHFETRAGAFPISIDFQDFSKMAAGKEVSQQAWEDYLNLKGQKIVFSCDRLDISKGIPYRLEAIRLFLKKNPSIHGKITFFQIVIPSRSEIPIYHRLKEEIDRLVGEINSQFGQTGWVPIQYLFRSISRKELLSLYRISEVALITPIKDGMNLIAKEYVASNVDENGVLILSEFAGAAIELQKEALLVNPYDIEGLSDAIFAALMLSPSEIKKRMRKMRRKIRQADVYAWVHHFLNAAIAKELKDFPVIEEYIPVE